MMCGGLRSKGIKRELKEGFPIISIISIVRNDQAHIRETIESVINQTYANIEYIVVDGGSTDSTVEIIKEYEDKIDYWISEPDKGIYNANNKGFSYTTGDFINYMNSGDKFYNNDVIANIFPQYKDFDFIYGNTYMDGYKIIPEIVSEKMFLKQKTINHQAVFASRKCFDYLFDENLKVVADRDWILANYRKKYSFKYVDVDVTVYDNTGVSSKPEKFNPDFLKFIKKNYNFFLYLYFYIRKKLGRLIKRYY